MAFLLGGILIVGILATVILGRIEQHLVDIHQAPTEGRYGNT